MQLLWTISLEIVVPASILYMYVSTILNKADFDPTKLELDNEDDAQQF